MMKTTKKQRGQNFLIMMKRNTKDKTAWSLIFACPKGRIYIKKAKGYVEDPRLRDNIIPFTHKGSAAHNAEKTTFTCDFCDGVWASELEVYCHKAAHIDVAKKLIADNETHICLTCITKYNSNEDLFKHIKRRHLLSSEDAKLVEREIYICDSCTAIFFNKNMLIVHVMSHHGQVTSITPLPCPHCNKVIQCSTMYNHFPVYGIDVGACCPICFEYFEHSTHLERHLEKHYPYLFCNICNIQMKPEKFHEHVAEHCNLSSSYEKPGFEKYFVPTKQVRLLVTHRLNPSRGLLQDTLAICILCREICESKTEMQQHLSCHTHTATKPKPMPKLVKKMYTCFCSAEFSSNILLKQHLLKDHGPLLRLHPDSEVMYEMVVVKEECDADNTNSIGDNS